MEWIAMTAVCLMATLCIGLGAPAPLAASSKALAMPASCAGSDYCTERHELYPAALVSRMLRAANISFSNNDQQTGHRSSEDLAEVRDCPATRSEEPIYEIVDAAGAVRVVLQSEAFRQHVSIERCLAPGHVSAATAHFSQDTVDSFNLQCVERKLDLAFLVLNASWDGFEMVKSKTGIPVRCDCQLYSYVE